MAQLARLAWDLGGREYSRQLLEEGLKRSFNTLIPVGERMLAGEAAKLVYKGGNKIRKYILEKNKKMSGPPTPKRSPRRRVRQRSRAIPMNADTLNAMSRVRKVTKYQRKQKQPSIGVAGGKLKNRKIKVYSKRRKNLIGGVDCTLENGKIIDTTAQTVWIGHNVAPYKSLWDNVWRMIVKAMLRKIGFTIASFSDSLTGLPGYNIRPGDKFVVRYQKSDTIVDKVEHDISAGDTAFTVCATFQNNANLWNLAYSLTTFEFLPVTSGVAIKRMDFQNVSIYLDLKSSMKIQNRSANRAAAEADDVDRVPLYGKGYAGIGNGVVMQMRNNAGAIETKLVADTNTGYIEAGPDDVGMFEPIDQSYFKGVTKGSKVMLDPGQIKTSVLTYKKTHNINVLKKKLFIDDIDPKPPGLFGKYAFFGLEKILDPIGDETSKIKLAIEINHHIVVNMKERFPNPTAPVYFRSTLP